MVFDDVVRLANVPKNRRGVRERDAIGTIEAHGLRLEYLCFILAHMSSDDIREYRSTFLYKTSTFCNCKDTPTASWAIKASESNHF